MYTGLMPLHNKNGDPVAILAIDIEMDEIHRTRRNYNLITGASVLILAVLSFGFTYFWLRRRIIQPIVKLQTASTNFVTSSRNTQDPEDLRFEKPDIHTHDEMEELSDALLSMSEDMKRYMKTLVVDTAEKERISAEFNVAKQIQNDIMPSVFPAFPERGDFDIYAIMESSREIGGDFYDFFLVDDDHLAMVVGNVSGRGIPAALFMVIVKTLVKNRALQGFSPAEVMQSVSEQLLEGNRAEMFSTVWLAVVELSTGKGMASNAGHRHPILCRAGKKFELQVYRHTPPVGAMEGIRFRDHGFQLDPGDTLVVYTDGVTDAINEQEEMFGTDHILEALNREPEATPSVLLQTLKASVDRFSGTMPQIDDITMLALKYYGPGQTGQAK
jgi:sigma-B regulation protein RsbU (phosphoserine phosphatase)